MFRRENFYHCLYILLFQVTEILDSYPVWKEYKEQNHDLFISDRPTAGYLTGKMCETFSSSLIRKSIEISAHFIQNKHHRLFF